MCFNSCEYFKYNPVIGEGGCKRGKNPCPEDENDKCDRCGGITDEVYEFQELYVCEECLEELE